MEKGEISKIREKPGESNAGKYKGVKASNFAGPDKTYPINTMARARNALSRAHFSPQESSIKSKVYEKYPGLKERHNERTEKDANVSNLGRPRQETGRMSVEHKEKPDARKNDKRYSAYKSR